MNEEVRIQAVFVLGQPRRNSNSFTSTSLSTPFDIHFVSVHSRLQAIPKILPTARTYCDFFLQEPTQQNRALQMPCMIHLGCECTEILVRQDLMCSKVGKARIYLEAQANPHCAQRSVIRRFKRLQSVPFCMTLPSPYRRRRAQWSAPRKSHVIVYGSVSADKEGYMRFRADTLFCHSLCNFWACVFCGLEDCHWLHSSFFCIPLWSERTRSLLLSDAVIYRFLNFFFEFLDILATRSGVLCTSQKGLNLESVDPSETRAILQHRNEPPICLRLKLSICHCFHWWARGTHISTPTLRLFL